MGERDKRKKTGREMDDLRQRAECSLAKGEKRCDDVANLPRPGMLRLLHELDLHRIELELQNDELLRANRELAEVRDMYGELFEFAPVGLLTLNRAGAVLSSNQAGFALFGRDGTRLYGSSFRSLLHPHSRGGYDAFFDRLLHGGRRETCEIQIGIDGEAFPAQLVGVPLLKGERNTYLVAIIDLRSRRQVEEMRIAMQAAERANKAKSEFLANVSHDIRTPLNGVIGMLQLALKREADPKVQEYLVLADQAAHGLLDIIGDVLDLSRIESGNLTLEIGEMDLHGELEGLIAPFMAMANSKGLWLRYQPDPESPSRIMADRRKLRQVLQNLIGNAIKFTARGGVTFSVAAAHGGRIGSVLLFSVSDTGPGIPKGKLGRVFEKYVRLDEHKGGEIQGTGLGLAISRQFAEAMGGRIDVTSEVGKGSTFTLVLPLRLPAADSKAAETGPGEESRAEAAEGPARDVTGLKVLVVEDNTVNQLVAEKLLAERGCEVALAGSGREALDALTHRDFDLVLLDVSLEDTSGEEIVSWIRKGKIPGARTDLYVAAWTGYTQAGERERLLEAGMDDYLVKPLSSMELDRVLGKARAGG